LPYPCPGPRTSTAAKACELSPHPVQTWNYLGETQPELTPKVVRNILRTFSGFISPTCSRQSLLSARSWQSCVHYIGLLLRV
jgi:hypothetical protein